MFYEKETYNLPALFCSKLVQFTRPNMIPNIIENIENIEDRQWYYDTIIRYKLMLSHRRFHSSGR
jgi:hypothetical protein